MFKHALLACVAISLTSATAAWAQAAPGAECVRQAGAPAWLPCGPDRTLSDAEVSGLLVKDKQVTKLDMTGGSSGRKFFINLHPGGKLELGVVGATNFGRDWKTEGGKLCLRAYQNVWQGQFNCGTFAIADGKLFWVEVADNSKNPITGVSYVAP